MNTRKLLLIASLFTLAALSPNLWAQTEAIDYDSDNQANVEPATPLTDLLKLMQDTELNVAIDRELLVMQERRVILSKGVWLDSEVAAYKNKFNRLPTVLPFSREKTEQEKVAYEAAKSGKKAETGDIQDQADGMTASDPAEKTMAESESDFKGPPLGLSGGYQRSAPEYNEAQLAAIIMRQGKSEDLYYLYVDSPEDYDAKNALMEQLVALFSDDFQQKLDDSGFMRLPEQFVKLWRVRLGLLEPAFPGGYQ